MSSAADDAASEPVAAAGAAQEEDMLDLHRYQHLQRRIATLEGLQIKAQLFAQQRRAEALQCQLDSMEKLQQESRAAVAKAEEQCERLRGSKWTLGKLLTTALGRKGSREAAATDALDAAFELLRQREQQSNELEAQLQEATSRLAVWQAKEAVLAAAEREVAELEAAMFTTASSLDGSQRKLEVLDALCSMEEEGSVEDEDDETEGSEQGGGSAAGERSRQAEEPGAAKAPVHHATLLRVSDAQLARAAEGQGLEVEVDEKLALDLVESKDLEGETEEAASGSELQEGQAEVSYSWGKGKLLHIMATQTSNLASALDRLPSRKRRDKYGQLGRGRLLRIAADKMKRAADARRTEKEAGMEKVFGAIGSHKGAKQKLEPDASLAPYFPKDACNFNPAIHCPPSTFLFLYPSRFMGKLQKLQTGPVLQAFYRFGPFDCDPNRPRRLIPRAPEGPPLILLTGLGSTMIAWGVPLLRALATEHEVIIVEYRGAGLSKVVGEGEEPWDYYNQAEAILLLADALGIPKFNWLGWSSGGNTGLVLAALHGERLHKMCSLAGMAGGPNTIVPPTYAALNPDMSLSLGQTMALIFPPDDPKEFKATCAQYIKAVFSMPGSITDQEVGPQAAREQWLADQEFIHRDGRVWDALPRVATPCLIMNGDKDVLVPHENAERIAARIPGARLHTWHGWGHGFKDAARLAQAVNEFLLDG